MRKLSFHYVTSNAWWALPDLGGAQKVFYVDRIMRLVVVGTAGSGKSTFATELAGAMNHEYIELDLLYWGPGWVPVPPETFESSVRSATEGDRWIVDGNYSSIRDLLWTRATHIVWLNFGVYTVLPRVLARTIKRILFKTQLSHGNRESFRAAFLSRDSILLWSLTSFVRNRRKFAALRNNPSYSHLQWTEINHPSYADAVIETMRRS